jgi:hypothetical protein
MIRLSPDEERRADMLLVAIIREIIHAEAGEAVALRALADAAGTLLCGGRHDLRVFWENELGRAAQEAAEFVADDKTCKPRGSG